VCGLCVSVWCVFLTSDCFIFVCADMVYVVVIFI